MQCLVSLTTIDGTVHAQLPVRSLHQLASLMPSSVYAYTVDVQAELGCTSLIDDAELYALLVGVIADASPKT